MAKTSAEKEELGQEIVKLSFKTELNSDDTRLIIRFIAEQADTNVRDKWGHTSLMYASRDGRSNIVRELLLRGGSDPNLANRCHILRNPIPMHSVAIMLLGIFLRMHSQK